MLTSVHVINEGAKHPLINTPTTGDQQACGSSLAFWQNPAVRCVARLGLLGPAEALGPRARVLFETASRSAQDGSTNIGLEA